MKELMIHVERIVRPVRADASKLRMRRELLAHLQASFEQERASGLDEPAAIAAAKRRLGDPIQLTRELQASVPRWERLSVTPFPRHFTTGLAIVGLLTLVAVALVPAGLISRHDRCFVGMNERAMWQARSMVFAGTLVLELSLLLWYLFVIGFFRSPVPWFRVVWAGIAAFASQFAWMSLFMFAVTSRWHLDYFVRNATALLLLPGFFAAGGIGTILAKRPAKEWLELDIADQPVCQ